MKKIVIKQYMPHQTIKGFNVKECENSLSREEAVRRIAKAFNSIKDDPKAAAELALDLLLTLEER